MNICPPEFRAGVHCGLIRHDSAAKSDPASDVLAGTENAEEIHDILVYHELVIRDDRIQLLTYPASGRGRGGRGIRRLSSIDYGFAFGGVPDWTTASLMRLATPQLPQRDAIGQPYVDGTLQRSIVARLRRLDVLDVETTTREPGLLEWGLTLEEADGVRDLVIARARELVIQYDSRYEPQIEAFDDRSL